MMNNNIGKKISSLRKSKNITQTELAQYLFVTPQTVSKWEAGNGTPDISLIPKIANLFDVSLDYLFDMTDAQRVRDMISKYSVLKDDHSFEAARSMVDSMLDDPSVDSNEKTEYYALKGHLYLQRSRDSISKALEATNRAIECSSDSDKSALIMQTYLLRLMNGEFENVKQECKQAFSDKPNAENLYFYLEVLMILNNYDDVISVVENNSSASDIMQDKSNSLKCWIQYFQAIGNAGSLEKAKNLYDELSTIVSEQDLLTMSIIMAKLLAQNADPKLGIMKDTVYSLLDKIEFNEYIRKEISAQIQAL